MTAISTKALTLLYLSLFFKSSMNVIVNIIIKTIAFGLIKNTTWYIKLLLALVFALIITSFLP